MPEEKRWKVTRITSPSASWDLLKKISRARLQVISEFGLSSNDDETKITGGTMTTRLEFISNDDEKVVEGYITIHSRASIDSQLGTDVLRPNDSQFTELADDVASVLFGVNRAEIQRIASSAGLSAQVIVPILKLDRDKNNLALGEKE